MKSAADMGIAGGIESQADVIDGATSQRGFVPARGACRTERVFPFGACGAVAEMHVALGIDGDGGGICGFFIDVFGGPGPVLGAGGAGGQQPDGGEDRESPARTASQEFDGSTI